MRIALDLEQNSWSQVTSAVAVQYTKIFKKLMIENWQQISSKSELPSVSKHVNYQVFQSMLMFSAFNLRTQLLGVP